MTTIAEHNVSDTTERNIALGRAVANSLSRFGCNQIAAGVGQSFVNISTAYSPSQPHEPRPSPGRRRCTRLLRRTGLHQKAAIGVAKNDGRNNASADNHRTDAPD